MSGPHSPVVLITGASGNLGRSVAGVLARDYLPVGLDLRSEEGKFTVLACDFTSDDAVRTALQKFRDTFGSHIASVIHLAAYCHGACHGRAGFAPASARW